MRSWPRRGRSTTSSATRPKSAEWIRRCVARHVSVQRSAIRCPPASARARSRSFASWPPGAATARSPATRSEREDHRDITSRASTARSARKIAPPQPPSLSATASPSAELPPLSFSSIREFPPSTPPAARRVILPILRGLSRCGGAWLPARLAPERRDASRKGEPFGAPVSKGEWRCAGQRKICRRPSMWAASSSVSLSGRDERRTGSIFRGRCNRPTIQGLTRRPLPVSALGLSAQGQHARLL